MLKDISDTLGISSFLPRSYIEQVQLLQLTQEFATLTDKARQHFDMHDDGVIIDDHVIGASPARKLLHHSTAHLRHSTDSPLRAVTSLPQRQVVGFKEPPAATSLGSPSLGLRDENDASLAAMAAARGLSAPAPGRISREVSALSIGRRSTSPEDGADALGTLPSDLVDPGTARKGDPSPLSLAAPPPRPSASRRSAAAADATAAAIAELRGDVHALTQEVREAARLRSSAALAGGALAVAAAAFALGAAVTAGLLRGGAR